jgi:cyanophycin synthetase
VPRERWAPRARRALGDVELAWRALRVPIVAVTGTNGKTTTVRMISHIMKTAGRRVGMTTTDGIYIDGTQILSGDMSGPTSAQMVLKNPTIDYAVLETARGGILRSGLGYDRCDIAVVTNIASDHLGLHGIDTLDDLAKVKSVVTQSVFRDGTSVLNADNEYVVDMARTARGEIIFFSMDEDNPILREHLRQRGKAVVLRPTRHGEMITIIEHRRETSLILASEIPATFGGRLRVNIANAMAAAAAALGDDIQLEYIRQALRGFNASYFQTPGRFNFLDVDGRHVVMDYCHNVAGLQSMVDFVERLGAPHSIGMIAMPGDRQDEDIRTFGELAARSFDRLVIREDVNRRGRANGEVASMLKQVALETGMLPDRVTIEWDEIEAARLAIESAERDDLVVLLVDRPADVWKELEQRATARGQLI